MDRIVTVSSWFTMIGSDIDLLVIVGSSAYKVLHPVPFRPVIAELVDRCLPGVVVIWVLKELSEIPAIRVIAHAMSHPSRTFIWVVFP